MTRNETTIMFDDRIDELLDEKEELAQTVAGMDTDNPAYPRERQRGTEIEEALQALRWARDEAADDTDTPSWDEDVDRITLAGLDGVEWAVTDDKRREDGASGRVGLLYDVVAGTVEAPYHDPDAAEEQQFGAVGELPPVFLRWAARKIDGLSTVGNGDEKSFADLVAEKRAETQTES